MALPNIFSKDVSDSIINRINQLTPQTQAKWGKMNVAQMLAHCCVTYEYIYENIHKPNNFLIKLMLKFFVKKSVVNEEMYGKSIGTGPDFLIKTDREFEVEKQRLIAYIEKTQALGEAHFDGKESHSFGVLNKTEWNNMLYKHLNHHLTQFGV